MEDTHIRTLFAKYILFYTLQRHPALWLCADRCARRFQKHKTSISQYRWVRYLYSPQTTGRRQHTQTHKHKHINTRAQATHSYPRTTRAPHPHAAAESFEISQHRPRPRCIATHCSGISAVPHALDRIATVVTCGCPGESHSGDDARLAPQPHPTRAHLHLLVTASYLYAPPCTLHRPSPASAHLRTRGKHTTPLASKGGPDRQCRRGIAPAPCPP